MSAFDRAKLDGVSATKAAAALAAVQEQLRTEEDEEREREASAHDEKLRQRAVTEAVWRAEQRANVALLRGSGDLSEHLRWDERRALWTALDGTPIIEATRGLALW